MIEKNDTAEPIQVIIADDHVLYRAGVKTALSAKKDIKVIAEADNGMHLLNMLKNTTADVILLDIQMPVMDGYHLLEHIRKLSTLDNCRFIFYTASSEKKEVEKGLLMGADDYIIKPFDGDELINKLKRVLG